MLFADQLKRARKQRTQRQAAKALNRPYATYCNWEQGRNEPDKELGRMLVRKLREG